MSSFVCNFNLIVVAFHEELRRTTENSEQRTAKAMNLGTSGKQGAEINVTPLIDVLLVLLIIFMILTPLHPVGEKALIPQPPDKDRPEIVQPSVVALQMTPDPA